MRRASQVSATGMGQPGPNQRRAYQCLSQPGESSLQAAKALTLTQLARL